MGILQITTDTAGQINVNPRRVKIITTADFATVTSTGYLNDAALQGYTIFPTDVIDMDYSFNPVTNTGTYSEFIPSIVNGVITLSQPVNTADKSQLYFASTSGTNTYTATVPNFPTTLTPGLMVFVLINSTNTVTNPTLNINGLGAFPIQYPSLLTSAVGDYVNGLYYLMIFTPNAWTAYDPLSLTTLPNSIYNNKYHLVTDTGTANSYNGSLNLPSVFALMTGGEVLLIPANNNTGASSFTINGGSPQNIVLSNGTPLVGGEILASVIAVMVYSSTNQNWQLLNPATAQSKNNILANTVSWAGGATSNAFTITGLTTSSIVIPAIQAQTTGTSYIVSYTVTANTLTVTFSSNPGAMVLQYVAFKAPQ
jgi:hypothetical protein